MGKARTHISIPLDLYKEAKALAEELQALGQTVTMEEAVYRVKKKRKEDFRIGGWGI